LNPWNRFLSKQIKGENMQLEQMTIGDIQKLTSIFGTKKRKEIKDGGIRIVILQRGWVVVGRFSQSGSECKITNGYVIRRWGTTSGLGQLAVSGPLPDTKLEATPEITFHELTKIADIKCEELKWVEKCQRIEC
jgi:hypothetical protein